MSRIVLPRVYPITDCTISGLSHVRQVELLLDGGASLIQLREKAHTPVEFFQDARAALAIARSRNAVIIVNDRADIALAIKADGVHLGQDDLPPEAARRMLGDDAIIGFSTHNLKQAREAIQLPVDYIAFGPVFATSTKQNPDAIVGLETLRRVRETIVDHPLVAIGGITLENAEEVLNAGADSVAVISAIVRDPTRITEQMAAFTALNPMRI
jgi:thiamine-phosphate pyrophosphorylase